MKRFFCCFAVSLLSFQAVAAPEVKGNPEELRSFLHPRERTVTLNGEAEEKAHTDKAIVSLVVTTEAKQMAAALSANTQLRNSLKEKLVAQGIKSEDVKNATFSSTPEYGWFGKKPDSYKVVNRVTVVLFDEKHMQAAAQLADQSDEIEISSTEFEHSTKAEAELSVRRKAVKKILQQKAFYEKSLGVALVPVSFHEGNVGFRATDGAERVRRTTKSKDAIASMSTLQREPDSAPKASSFDEIVYTAHLSVEYKIVEK